MAQRSAPTLDGFEGSDFKNSNKPRTSRPSPPGSGSGSSKTRFSSSSSSTRNRSWFSRPLTFPGDWEEVEGPIHEATPFQKAPGFSIDVGRSLDQDLQHTRDWSYLHQLFWDKEQCPDGGYGFMTSVKSGSTQAHAQYNGAVMGALSHTFKALPLTLAATAELIPITPQTMQMGLTDQYKLSAKYKRATSVLAAQIGTSDFSASYVASVLPGISCGVKTVGKLSTAIEMTNSYFARWRSSNRKNSFHVMYDRNEWNCAFVKTLSDTQGVRQNIVTQLKYHPVSKQSSAKFGYGLSMGPMHISAAIDSDFKVALSATSAPSQDLFFQFMSFSLFTEIDHKTYQHKLGAGVHINLPSEEILMAQDEERRQQMMGGVPPM